MKNTNKKIVAGLAASAIIALSFGSTYANGNGQGKGMGKGQGQNKEAHNPTDMLTSIEKQDVSAIEIDLLKKQYEEEMMANELYMSFYEKYGIQTFKNIAESEAKHMQAVKALLDRYEIEVPKNYDHIQDLYENLKEKGSKSEFDALEVGVQIEFVDIDDIVKAIKATDNEDIKVVLTNIGGGSYNHLRGFLKAIDNNGYETDLDYTPYLEESDLSTIGPIKYKLAEKLESEGVELPEQVSSENMKKQKHDENSHGKKGEGKKYGKNKNFNKDKSKKINIFNKYKTAINSKYGNIINEMSNEKLQKLSLNIDSAIEKVEFNSRYNTETKQKYSLILGALKEIIQEKLDI